MLNRTGISADRLAALVLIIVFTVYGLYGSTLESSLGVDVVGPDFFPRAIAVFGAFLSVLLFLKRPEDDGGDAGGMAAEIRALIPLGMMLIYVFSLDFLGFPIATALFLLVVVKYLGCPSWLGAVAFAVLSTAAAVLLFRYALVLRLPRGDLIWFW